MKITFRKENNRAFNPTTIKVSVDGESIGKIQKVQGQDKWFWYCCKDGALKLKNTVGDYVDLETAKSQVKSYITKNWLKQ